MKSDRGSWRPLRRDELRDELVHDAYKAQRKHAEPTRCPQCGVVYTDGRWTWGLAPAGAHEERCPACQRMRDHFPAGYLVLTGEFLAGHRDELLQLARHREAKETAEHPLERIMDIEDVEGGVQITTTDTHLARDIGEALHSAYKGALEYHYNKEENLLRVHWAR
jgi:NMD protein affecting ribosome stability and mRNA decay